MSPNARFRRGLLKCLFSRTATLELQKNRQIGALGHSFHFGITVCGNSRKHLSSDFLSPLFHRRIGYSIKTLRRLIKMSDLTASSCGCSNNNSNNNNSNCACNWIWIILLLSCFGGNDCGCGGNGLGIFNNNGDGNCACNWIWIILLLSCFGGNGCGCGC